uniref:Large ribosomal subunit protein uL22c n=1 Tax=Larrea tridentata TaxID=66636 RepID=A0A0M5L3K3_LARTR|nr:ribosomal protein L22 [Larrea tridentata]ALE28895.1 ribosomal protein L22 [Larrea tridentata]QCW94691.1 ribosomal protein L22 [Larrea tridentata]
MNRKKKTSRPYTQAHAFGDNIRMSADKARRIIDQIRGRSYEETLMILELMPYRGCYPIFQLVYSAAANANHNQGLEKKNLVITQAEVNESTTSKKFKPRARGRCYSIKRRTCNITIVLTDVSLFEEICKEKEEYHGYRQKGQKDSSSYEESTGFIKKSRIGNKLRNKSTIYS